MTELSAENAGTYARASFEGAVHATSIAINGHGVLIAGPSGSGKSDLALRLVDRGAMLVSDDYTHVHAENGAVIASAPMTIKGMMEIRGIGIEPLPCVDHAKVALLVKALEPGMTAERIPLVPELRDICGVALPLLRLGLLEASAPL
jgi:serine kinase of HPr protein (carbohydrate metabolism regulator)